MYTDDEKTTADIDVPRLIVLDGGGTEVHGALGTKVLRSVTTAMGAESTQHTSTLHTTHTLGHRATAVVT